MRYRRNGICDDYPKPAKPVVFPDPWSGLFAAVLLNSYRDVFSGDAERALDALYFLADPRAENYTLALGVETDPLSGLCKGGGIHPGRLRWIRQWKAMMTQ